MNTNMTGFKSFQRFLRSCPFDEGSHSIERVKAYKNIRFLYPYCDLATVPVLIGYASPNVNMSHLKCMVTLINPFHAEATFVHSRKMQKVLKSI